MSEPERYPIELRDGEIDRLRFQSDAFSFDAGVMLDRIGSITGGRALDLGCGPGGITDLLSKRVGPCGKVLGLDADPRMIAEAKSWAAQWELANVDYVVGDAFQTGLPDAAFDLVHARFILSTTGGGEGILSEMLRLLKPGGILAIQEPDLSTLRCFPQHDAWTRLVNLMTRSFEADGARINLGPEVYARVLKAGLESVELRACMAAARKGDGFSRYLPEMILSLVGTIAEHRLAEPADYEPDIEAVRHHLANPETTFTSFTVFQVWGRKSA